MEVWIGVLLAIIASVVSPYVLANVTDRSRRRDKQEDWKRQDDVAAKADAAAMKAAEAATAATEAAKLVALQVLETNTRRGQAEVDINGKLDTIHTLVNSSYTSSIKAELASTTRELVLLLESDELKEAAGKKPNGRVSTAIEAAELRIDELNAILKERAHTAAAVEAQAQAETGKSSKALFSPTTGGEQ